MISQGLKKADFKEKKFYAVVNLSCKKIDERFKKVYTIYTKEKIYTERSVYIPLR